jgi:hypothetical protein
MVVLYLETVQYIFLQLMTVFSFQFNILKSRYVFGNMKYFLESLFIYFF